MRSKKQELISGGINGDLMLYDLKQSGNIPTGYRYHRDSITDICFLTKD